MNPLRISRIVGFGTKPPKDFIQSPVTFGTASSCSIAFDAVFDKGVAPQHAKLELNQGSWFLLDGGAPGGTWVDGLQITEPYEVNRQTTFTLGAPNGPKVKLELLPALVEPSTPRPPLTSPLPGLLAGFASIALVAGVCWYVFHLHHEPSIVVQTTNSVQAQVAPVVPDDHPPVTDPSPNPVTPGSQPLPPEVQQQVDEIKKSDTFHIALLEFWRNQHTRSPYAQAILKNEDQWIAHQLPWMRAFEESRKQTTGHGHDFPGFFVPEATYPEAEGLGIPLLSSGFGAYVDQAVAEKRPEENSHSSVATTSAQKAAISLFPSKAPVLKKLNTFAMGEESVDQSEPTPQAWALLIGINGFEESPQSHECNNLTGCRNDVAAIGKVLVTQGIFEPDHVRLMTDVRKGTTDYPSKSNVIAALKDLVSKAGTNDVIYLGFSTHGGYDPKRKDSALVMADSILTGDYLYGSELNGILDQVKAKNLIISMDACHTGGMSSEIGGTQLSTASVAGKVISRIPDSFYERLGSSRGHVVIRACRSDQSTPDVITLGHGLLTALLISGLTGDADSNGDGIVTLSELRIYVTTAIPAISKRELELKAEAGHPSTNEPLQPTFTSSSFGEAGDLPLTVVAPSKP